MSHNYVHLCLTVSGDLHNKKSVFCPQGDSFSICQNRTQHLISAARTAEPHRGSWNLWTESEAPTSVTEESTENGGRQGGLDDGKGGIISFMEDMDLTALQQVLGQDALKTFQNSDPLPLLRFTFSQHQKGYRGQR